ncbi:MAG: uridylate kinase, partial [Thermoplasmata archaeon]|nr:uridylate kinase [Thermoplasmata archaeon]
DPEDPASLISRVARTEIDTVLSCAGGRMKKKVLAARDALTGGVASVVIASSQGKDPVARALSGGGTVFQ